MGRAGIGEVFSYTGISLFLVSVFTIVLASAERIVEF